MNSPSDNRPLAPFRDGGYTKNSEAARLLTAEQLAERWQIKKSTVYALTREGKVPAVRLGPRLYRYRVEAIEEYERTGGEERS